MSLKIVKSLQIVVATFVELLDVLFTSNFFLKILETWGKECVSTGAAGAQTRRYFGHLL